MTKKPSKKILVWTLIELKERNGGPSSYLYNLSRLLNNSNFSIDYLPLLIPQKQFNHKTVELKDAFSNKLKRGLKKILPSNITKKIRIKNSYALALQNYTPSKEGLQYVNLKDYSAIHFHNTLELVRLIPFLKDFEGKIILTPHTPCPPYEHELNHLLLNTNNLSETDYNKIVELDVQAFQRADYIVLPTLNAIDAYFEGYNRVVDFQELLKQKTIHYIPTGVPKSVYQKEKIEVRKELNIPENAFIVHYAGRHNEEKGYDLLVEFGKKILSKYDNIYFIITGSINNKISFPDNSKWIEIGWTTDPFSYANAADMFILPNRISYFDLVLLEMVALNLPILISDVGGNQFFKKHANELDIAFFKSGNLTSLLNEFENFKEKKFELKNKLFFKNHLSIEAMADNYRKFYEKILVEDR